MSGKFRHDPIEKGAIGKPYAEGEGITLAWVLPIEHYA